jgi:hypothetical protein
MSTTSAAKSNLPLVQPSIGSPPQRGQSSVATGQAAALNENQRCMTVQSTGIPISSRGAGLSGHDGIPQQAQSSAQSTATSQDRKTISEEAPPTANSQNEKMIIERASQPPSLDGIVDLSNTVDTKIKTTQPLGTYLHPYSAHPRKSVISRTSTTTPLFLSPLHVTPNPIVEPTSFPPPSLWPSPKNLPVPSLTKSTLRNSKPFSNQS